MKNPCYVCRKENTRELSLLPNTYVGFLSVEQANANNISNSVLLPTGSVCESPKCNLAALAYKLLYLVQDQIELYFEVLNNYAKTVDPEATLLPEVVKGLPKFHAARTQHITQLLSRSSFSLTKTLNNKKEFALRRVVDYWEEKCE